MAHAQILERPKSRQTLDDKIPALKAHSSRADQLAMGKAMRDKCPRAAHAAARRAGPFEPMQRGENTRLVPFLG